MSFLAIFGSILYALVGAVVGQAMVRLNVDRDGFWPENRVKKSAIFVCGLVLWPLFIVAGIIWLCSSLYGDPLHG